MNVVKAKYAKTITAENDARNYVRCGQFEEKCSEKFGNLKADATGSRNVRGKQIEKKDISLLSLEHTRREGNNE
jgi:hypothetical protein